MGDSELTEYELQRQARIARNRAILEDLQLVQESESLVKSVKERVEDDGERRERRRAERAGCDADRLREGPARRSKRLETSGVGQLKLTEASSDDDSDSEPSTKTKRGRSRQKGKAKMEQNNSDSDEGEAGERSKRNKNDDDEYRPFQESSEDDDDEDDLADMDEDVADEDDDVAGGAGRGGRAGGGSKRGGSGGKGKRASKPQRISEEERLAELLSGLAGVEGMDEDDFLLQQALALSLAEQAVETQAGPSSERWRTDPDALALVLDPLKAAPEHDPAEDGGTPTPGGGETTNSKEKEEKGEEESKKGKGSASKRRREKSIGEENGAQISEKGRPRARKKVSVVLPPSEEEIDMLFFSFDESGRGRITASDVRRQAIAHDYTWTDEEIADMVNLFDSNGDGALDMAEFRSMALRSKVALK